MVMLLSLFFVDVPEVSAKAEYEAVMVRHNETSQSFTSSQAECIKIVLDLGDVAAKDRSRLTNQQRKVAEGFMNAAHDHLKTFNSLLLTAGHAHNNCAKFLRLAKVELEKKSWVSANLAIDKAHAFNVDAVHRINAIIGETQLASKQIGYAIEATRHLKETKP